MTQGSKATVAAAAASSAGKELAAASQQQQHVVLLLGVFVLTVCCCCICIMQYRSVKRRREDHESEPLLSDAPSPSMGVRHRERHDVASIGTPARDFVRLSSLPAAVFQPSDTRCRACGQADECVALRPCGHAVLCRPCSDFVFECPQCGQYISGISFHNVMSDSVHGGIDTEGGSQHRQW